MSQIEGGVTRAKRKGTNLETVGEVEARREKKMGVESHRRLGEKSCGRIKKNRRQ